jgi:pyridoxine 5'-phosphate synthase PdxJ
MVFCPHYNHFNKNQKENTNFAVIKQIDMLGLKLATDPRWVNIVESNIEEILTDHAWCEQKAASNAISLITYNSIGRISHGTFSYRERRARSPSNGS